MKQKTQSMILRVLMYCALIATGGAVAGLVCYILVTGLPNINMGLFSFVYDSNNASLFPALVNTILILALALFLAVPLGVGSAIYLNEYAKKQGLFQNIMGITCQTLQSIPSIIYGLFGLLFFVTALKWQFSLLAGGFTLAIMILPVITRCTQEALSQVEDGLRQGGLALGASKFRTIMTIVLPRAKASIINGIILSSGRVIGESAALIYTAGTVAKIPKNLLGQGRTLSVHLYCLLNEGIKTQSAQGCACVLVFFVLILLFSSRMLCKTKQKE